MKHTKFAGKYKNAKVDPNKRVDPVVKPEPVQPIARPGKFVPHGGTAKPNPQYTGQNVLGVTVMHKSCLQPVFDQEHAIDAAKMRR